MHKGHEYSTSVDVGKTVSPEGVEIVFSKEGECESHARSFQVACLKVQKQSCLFQSLSSIHAAVNALETALLRQVPKKSNHPYPGSLAVFTKERDVQCHTFVNDCPGEFVKLVGQPHL